MINNEYAIKMVQRENLKKFGEKGLRNLRNEYEILWKIKHKNIINLEEHII
jgi:hypothetical protein